MNRREFCAASASASVLASLGPLAQGAATGPSNALSNRLFFDPSDIGKIQANARSAFLGPLYMQWSSIAVNELSRKLDTFEASREIIRDFAAVLNTLTQLAVVQIVEPSARRENALVNALDRLIEAPYWDYFLDGPDKPIGIQRAATAIVRILFTREVLGSAIDPALDNKILSAVAEKGCLPCFRTVHGMDEPDTVIGWQFDALHADYYDIDMSRWPTILGANNLRAAPTAALGIGAIALRGRDDRAEHWLETAVASSRRVMKLFSPDGSYFEGVSYAGYTLRTSLGFFEAHQRCVGGIDWAAEANFAGIIDFILSSQMGLQEDGSPDIVNFSDAKNSVYPCVPSWIARHTDNPVAQFATEIASKPYYYLDFLWYETSRPSEAPPAQLKNVHNDLDWVLCRSGWGPDDAVLAFKSGGPANHEHADRNHITYKIHGERLLNDNFGAAYDRRHDHWLLRQTEAHNAVLVDGKGCNYHNGIEGTNDSLSYANIIEYQDYGDTVWWTSDATAAYRIDNEPIFKVLRTVIFAKPDIIVVLDQVRLRYQPQRVDLRFFPDNRDKRAEIQANSQQFTIDRPRARLRAQVAARSDLALSQSKLDLPADIGDFPYVEISSAPALTHEIVTLMDTSRSGVPNTRNTKVTPISDGWEILAGDLRATINTSRNQPAVVLS